MSHTGNLAREWGRRNLVVFMADKCNDLDIIPLHRIDRVNGRLDLQLLLRTDIPRIVDSDKLGGLMLSYIRCWSTDHRVWIRPL